MVIAITATISSVIRVVMKIAGDSTNHHDQSMTLVSLRVMNTMVSSPKKPMPPVLLDDTLFVCLLML